MLLDLIVYYCGFVCFVCFVCFVGFVGFVCFASIYCLPYFISECLSGYISDTLVVIYYLLFFFSLLVSTHYQFFSNVRWFVKITGWPFSIEFQMSPTKPTMHNFLVHTYKAAKRTYIS